MRKRTHFFEIKENFIKKIFPILPSENWQWKYKMLDKILIMLLALCLCDIVSSELKEIIDQKVCTYIIKSRQFFHNKQQQ